MEFLENGGFWQRQGHIYNHHFIILTIRLHKYVRSNFGNDQLRVMLHWKDYLNLCNLGGSQSFLRSS